MAFTPKDWKNANEGVTPLDAAAIEDLETRLSTYTDDKVSAFSSARFTGIYFGGDDLAGPRLFMAVSADMENWNPHGPPLAEAATSPFVVRDPDVIDWKGALWLAHTHQNFGTSGDAFGLQKSLDGGLNWTAMTDVSIGAANTALGGTINRCWVDQWFEDPTGGRPWLFISVSTNGDPGPFKRVAIQVASDDFTSWGTPVVCSSGLPTSSLDYSPILINGTWNVFVKDNTFGNERIVRLTSATGFLGPWTVADSDVVTGWQKIEASNITTKDDGSLRLYFDHYIEPPATDSDQDVNPDADLWRFRHAQTYYVESSDNAATWSDPPVAVRGLGRHTRVRRIRTVNMGWIVDTARTSVCEVANSSTLARPTGNLDWIAFNVENKDTDGMFNVARPDVLVVRNAGEWRLDLHAIFAAAANAGVRYAAISVNYVMVRNNKKDVFAGTDATIEIGWSGTLKRGDEIRVQLYQNSDASLNMIGPPYPTLTATRIGS